jgi:hypothetical protein
MAKMYFDDWIKPFLDTEASNINVDYCMLLLSAIMHFENSPDYGDLMKKLTDFVIRKLDIRLYEDLFDQIMKKFETFRSNEHILDLFRHHSIWLDGQIGPFTQFSWCMPEANIPEHKSVENFLKSDAQQCNYSNFISVKDAHRLANMLRRERYCFSVEARAYGKARDSYVEIKKTRDWYNRKVAQLSDYFKRKDKLNALNLNL